MNSLTDCIRALLGKDVTLVFASGEAVVGMLKRILPEDALVIKMDDGRIAICSTANLNMIYKGRFEEEDDDICVN